MKYNVIGHAFVPVQVRMEIQAKSPEAAMKKAKREWNKAQYRYRHIVRNSEDECAVWGFEPLDAEPANKYDRPTRLTSTQAETRP